MTQINPFIGSVVQASGVQRQQSAEKATQLRKAADVERNAGLSGDRFEHAVESAEALAPIHDEQKNDPKKRRQSQPRPRTKSEGHDDESHLDLTA